jgi:acyl dehydratase
MKLPDSYETLNIDFQLIGDEFSPTLETIKEFCEASLDHNPLHLDAEWVNKNFGSKTEFDGIVMHGMSQFSLYTKMITDWLPKVGGIHRRLETRWLIPVKPGDTVRPRGVLTSKQETEKSRWATIAVEMNNQRGEVVSKGEALIEFPLKRGSMR